MILDLSPSDIEYLRLQLQLVKAQSNGVFSVVHTNSVVQPRQVVKISSLILADGLYDGAYYTKTTGSLGFSSQGSCKVWFPNGKPELTKYYDGWLIDEHENNPVYYVDTSGVLNSVEGGSSGDLGTSPSPGFSFPVITVTGIPTYTPTNPDVVVNIPDKKIIIYLDGGWKEIIVGGKTTTLPANTIFIFGSSGNLETAPSSRFILPSITVGGTATYSSPYTSEIFFNTVDGTIDVYNGSTWKKFYPGQSTFSYKGIRLHLIANKTLTDGTPEYISWTIQDWQEGGTFHSAVFNPDTITIPTGESGKYQFNLKVIFDYAGGLDGTRRVKVERTTTVPTTQTLFERTIEADANHDSIIQFSEQFVFFELDTIKIEVEQNNSLISVLDIISGQFKTSLDMFRVR